MELNNNPNVIIIGSINYLLSPDTNTAKVIQSPNATGDITIETFVTRDSQNYLVQEIDDKTFCEAKIVSLSFKPDSCVKRIGNYAFQRSSIKKLSIPDSLEEFGDNWRYGALFLTDININPEHKFFQFAGGLLTSKDKHEILFAGNDLSGTVKLSSNITKILPYAFYSCNGITSLKLESSIITSIGPYSFYSCDNLHNVGILGTGQNLTLGQNCFAFCQDLTNVTISCNSLTLDNSCFECCKSISSLSFSIKRISIGYKSISGCSKLTSFTIPCADFIEINDRSFTSLYQFNSIYLNTKQFKISEKSFEDCTSIKKVYFNSNDEVNSEMFAFLKTLQEIDLTSLTTLKVENYSFCNMNELKAVRLRSKNLCLNEQCFGNQENVSSIIIECENQMNFKHELFDCCKALKYFKCTKSTYFNCSEKIDLDENCFADHPNLEEVEIVATEINLGNGCFRGSKNLQKVVLHGQNITIGENCFVDCHSLKSLIITELLKPAKGIVNTENNRREIEFEVNTINLGNNCLRV